MQYFRDSSSSTSVNKSSASNSSSNFVHHRSPFQGSQQHLPTRPDTPVFDQPTTHLEIPELLQDAEQSLSNEDYLVNDPTPAETATKKKILLTRSISLALVIGLLATIYVLWRPASTTTTDTASTDTTYATAETSNTTQTSLQNSKSSSTSSGQTTGIQAYIVGEIHHPGVYTLDTNARVYQLVQAAGGPLADANLAALNLAARLSDGQEVYVARLGETPPANIGANSNSSSNASTDSTTTASGTTVNINTAAAKDLQQTLHISSSNAQKIVDYRLQHGPYTSITTLAQILSSTVYKKVKDHVTL
jgi:competence protein ComEA